MFDLGIPVLENGVLNQQDEYSFNYSRKKPIANRALSLPSILFAPDTVEKRKPSHSFCSQ
jgi:hypothetical protein